MPAIRLSSLFTIALLVLSGTAQCDEPSEPVQPAAFHENFALAYQVQNRIERLDEGPTAIEQLEDDTGCNADGLGPAKYGCDFYEEEGTGNSFKKLKLRGGFTPGQVGVGFNVTW